MNFYICLFDAKIKQIVRSVAHSGSGTILTFIKKKHELSLFFLLFYAKIKHIVRSVLRNLAAAQFQHL